MQPLATDFTLPLLAKELTELAARRRTYVVRVAYALSLLFISWLAFQLSMTGRTLKPIDYLGRGRLVLWWLGYLQNLGMFLVLPALACDVFTREKERQTIGLLFLTRLSPLTIVFEKFLSRLFPAICLLSISLPLLAISYSLGGVEVAEIFNTGMGLITNAILLTSIAVFCSSLCQSSTAAFTCTYLLAACMPLMVISGRLLGNPFDFIVLGGYFHRALYLAPPSVTFGVGSGGSLPFGATSLTMLYGMIILSCLPSLVCATIYIVLARVFLISRAFKRSSGSPGFFRTQWQLLREFGQSLRLISRTDEREIPDLEPVTWRETRYRWMGHWLAILVAAICAAMMTVVWLAAGKSGAVQQSSAVSLWNLSLWMIMLLVLVTNSAGLITQERGQQTLFVLLTTPMAGREILRQKLDGLKPLIWMCLTPLGSCIILRMFLSLPKVSRPSTADVYYPLAFFNEATMLLIYPHLAIWIALYFSLNSKTTIAAILKTIVFIVVLCIGPWLMLMVYAVTHDGLHQEIYGPVLAFLLIGPEDLLLYGYEMETLPPGFDDAIWPLQLNSLIHGSLWFGLRHYCLQNADRLLGRGYRRFRAT